MLVALLFCFQIDGLSPLSLRCSEGNRNSIKLLLGSLGLMFPHGLLSVSFTDPVLVLGKCLLF